MEFNLKNRPRMEPGQPPYSKESVDKWFKGFKKGIQEMRAKHARVHPCTECDKNFEEILGNNGFEASRET